jgi:hypothetical protein
MRQTISANPRGTDLARFVQALVCTKSAGAAAQYAEKWRDSPSVRLTLAAAVDAQDTDDSISQFGIAAEFFYFFNKPHWSAA